MTTTFEPAGILPSSVATETRQSRAIAAGVALAVVGVSVASAYAGAHGLTRLLKTLHAPEGSLLETGLALGGGIAGGLLQLAVFFWLIRWLAGRDVLVWLVAPARQLGAGVFAAVILSMFVIKMLAVIGSGLIVSKSGAADIVKSLTPVLEIMKSPLWIGLLLSGILAAVAEEIIFRGYLSRVLETNFGFWFGALASAVVWAGLHVYYPLAGQAALVVIGVGLSWMRARTGSIYPGMAWHVANNAVALVAMRAMA